MAKKTKIDPDDLATFHNAVDGVKPLVHRKIRITPTKPADYIKPQNEKTELSFAFDGGTPEKVVSEGLISYKHPSISYKILRKLRKGQYNVDAILDLHGMTVERAKQELENFLQQCLQRNLRIALIIHGKGSRNQNPILKNKLNQWLPRLSVILAYCSAAPRHGGRGAIYVLLKLTRMTG